MDLSSVGKALERLLRDTEQLAARTRGDVRRGDPQIQRAVNEFGASLLNFQAVFGRMRSEMGSATNKERPTACARAWLNACLANDLFARIEELFRAIIVRAAAVAANTDDVESRISTYDLIAHVSQAAFMLLEHSNTVAGEMCDAGEKDADLVLGRKVLLALMDKRLIPAVADAARAVLSASARLRSDTTEQQASGVTYNMGAASAVFDELMGPMMSSVCEYARVVMDSLYSRLMVAFTSASNPEQRPIPPELVDVFDALAESQLLAAAASALLDCPPLHSHPLVSGRHRDTLYFSTKGGATSLAQALFFVFRLRMQLAEVGRLGHRLSTGLLRAARHEAVQRLQVALLDHLAAHAGLGVKLQEEQQQGQQQQGQGQAEAQGARGWEGSSGTWWLACEEARQGKILGAEGSGRAGWLEDLHCHVVNATLVEWLAVDEETAAAVRVLARPPPLLVARLAARAAESVCRLCRGQGLEGAYAPAPEWELGMSQRLLLQMLPLTGPSALPVATARACLPYWLEAAAWVLALATDATAAHMGRLSSSKPPVDPRSLLVRVHVRDGSQAGTVLHTAKMLSTLAYDSTYGFKTLAPAAQADVRRRMFRCGLAASLDHALRLTFSAQDSGRTAVATELRHAMLLGTTVVDIGLAPMYPLVDTPCGEGVSGGRLAEGGGGGAATGTRSEGTGPDLGYLFTLAKRASALAPAVEAVCAGSGGGAREQQGPGTRQQVLETAAEVLGMLRVVVSSMEEDVRQRVAAARQEAEGGSGGGSDSDAAWQVDAACVDEANEALALAARAACNLAAPLAWALAADLGATAAPMQLSAFQEKTFGAVCDLLAAARGWWRYPLLLPPAHLLACQPHRLLAAGCALVAALPISAEHLKWQMALHVPSLLVVIAAHKTLSGRARSWLAPLAAARGGGGGGSGGENKAGDDACTGCLLAPLQAALPHTLRLMTPFLVLVMALRKIAAGEVPPKEGVACCEGGGDATGLADGGFQQCAAAMAKLVWERFDNPDLEEARVATLPDGSTTAHVLLEVMDDDGDLPQIPPPAAPVGALPPPLELPPSRAGAFPRLRVCGNPRCNKFPLRCEAELELKKCGGCKAVRYCGEGCQRAHWREGHKAECKALAAGTGK